MTLLKCLIAAAAAFSGFVALMYVAQRSLMYHPERLRTPPAAAGLFDAQEIVLDTADGEKVIVWHVPPKDGKPLVLYFQGNAGSLRMRADRFRAFVEDGTGLVALSYRGYGGSTGGTVRTNLYELRTLNGSLDVIFVRAEHLPRLAGGINEQSRDALSIQAIAEENKAIVEPI